MPVKPKDKTIMPMMEPDERSKIFSEVNFGYNEAKAVFEARRCLRCQDPKCIEGCPVYIKIPDFINLIAEEKFEDAIRLIKQDNPLPAVCGRVCPQETQCEQLCHMVKRFNPVAIGYLERFAADWEMLHGRIKEDIKKKRKEKIAIVGSGPSGLVCAGDLARLGYNVTIFEALHAPGGVLRYGIPEFRLPKAILDFEIDGLRKLGVNILCNIVVGRTISLDEIIKEYDAIFIGTGAGLPKFLGIPGENLNGVYSANEFLTRINLMRSYTFPEFDTPIKVGEKVIVIGSGNTAMDAARSGLRAGAKESMIVYRRTIKEMTARIEEYEHALEEGIKFMWLTNPVRIIGDEDGWVKAMEVEKMKLGEPDESGRARPVGTGEKFILDTKNVIYAVGTTPNPLLSSTTSGLKTKSFGGLIINEETGETTKESVYAGGDAVTGAATVILAAGAGKKAALSIHKKLKGGWKSPKENKWK